jgi:hypothetical protein
MLRRLVKILAAISTIPLAFLLGIYLFTIGSIIWVITGDNKRYWIINNITRPLMEFIINEKRYPPIPFD